MLLTTAASLGVGLALAALIVTYRDFRYVIPFLVQSWMYLSPVIYPVSMVPPQWQPLLALNPMAGIIDGFRSALFGLPWNLTTLSVSTVLLDHPADLRPLLLPPDRAQVRRHGLAR